MVFVYNLRYLRFYVNIERTNTLKHIRHKNKSKTSIKEEQSGDSVEVIKKDDDGVVSKEDDQQTDPNIENEKEYEKELESQKSITPE